MATIELNPTAIKVGCIFPMVILSEFRIGQYRDEYHRKDAPPLYLRIKKCIWLKIGRACEKVNISFEKKILIN